MPNTTYKTQFYNDKDKDDIKDDIKDNMVDILYKLNVISCDLCLNMHLSIIKVNIDKDYY